METRVSYVPSEFDNVSDTRSGVCMQGIPEFPPF